MEAYECSISGVDYSRIIRLLLCLAEKDNIYTSRVPYFRSSMQWQRKLSTEAPNSMRFSPQRQDD